MNNAPLPIAVQMYTLRSLTTPLDDLLGQLAAIGYSGIETVGNQGVADPAELRGLLDKHGLTVCSAHVALAQLEADMDEVVRFHQAIGNQTLVIPWIGETLRAPDAAGWRQLGGKLDGLGQQLRDQGMKLLYHNHAFEMAEIEGELAIDWLLDGADARNLGFEIDLAWVQRGNQNGVKLLSRYAGRCPRVHCKDVAAAGQNEDQMGFADVGYGVMVWGELLAAAKAAGAEWYIVEHDLPKEPLESVRRSYGFLSKQLA